MNKNFRDTRLLEAFEYIDPKYVNEVGKDLKLRSVYSKDGEGSGNKMRMSLKQITVLAACALLLAFAIPLFGYVAGVVGSFVAGTAGAGSDPGRESIEDSLPEETNAEQADVNNKYSEYGREEIGENGEKIFYLYTSEEYGAYLEAKKNKAREPLTPEDVVFIINDSVRLYFEYDKIYFSDALKIENGSTQYMVGDISAAFNNGFIDTDLMEAARYVIPYHGDFSELNAESAEDRYNKMLDDIYVIIYRRLEIHCGDICEHGYQSAIDPYDLYAGILLDGCKISNYDDYIKESRTVIRTTVNSIKNGNPTTNEYPVVIVAPFTSEEVYVSIVNDGASESVFPTKELIDLKPQK